MTGNDTPRWLFFIPFLFAACCMGLGVYELHRSLADETRLVIYPSREAVGAAKAGRTVRLTIRVQGTAPAARGLVSFQGKKIGAFAIYPDYDRQGFMFDVTRLVAEGRRRLEFKIRGTSATVLDGRLETARIASR